MIMNAVATRVVDCSRNKSSSKCRFSGGNINVAFFASSRMLFWGVVASLITAGSVRAENRESAVTLSAFAGGQGFPFGGDTHYDGDFNWGVRAGYNITARFGLEVVFSENKTVHDPEVAFCTIHQYGVDALYYFQPEKKLVPFVAAGFGVFDVNFDGTFDGPPSNPPLSDETNPYAQLG